MIPVTFIYREVRKTGFSIEGIFDVVRQCLKKEINDSEYYFNPKRSRLWNIFNVHKLPDHVNHITGDVYFLTLGLKSKKNIVTIHDLAHYEYLRKSPLKFWAYHYFWLYFPLKKATVITAVSESTKEKLISSFNFTKDKVRVVYNPVKPIYQCSQKVTINIQPRILQIGTGEHKNLNNLIEAVKGSNYFLDIIAFPDEKCIEKLKKYNIAYSIENGLTDEQLYQKYIESDIVFFASFEEGFGMPIIEAQAVGRPVITSRRGAMLEIGKDAAVMVDPHSILEIRQAIDRLVTDTDYYKHIVDKGLTNASKYNAEKIAEDYLNIYKELNEPAF